MSAGAGDLDSMRLMARVLTLHYEEGLLQSEVATKLGLSSAKVNRLIKQGRELGLVQITINTPFQRLFELERRLTRRWNLKDCLVVPAVTGSAEATLNQVGRGAALVLVEDDPGRRHDRHVRRQGGAGDDREPRRQPFVRRQCGAHDRRRSGAALHRRQPHRDGDSPTNSAGGPR